MEIKGRGFQYLLTVKRKHYTEGKGGLICDKMLANWILLKFVFISTLKVGVKRGCNKRCDWVEFGLWNGEIYIKVG